MRARIQKWGNSLAVRIPKAFADEVHLQENADVELKLIDGHIVLAPVKDRSYDLDDLLSKVTPENIHSEIDTGTAAGNEVW